MKIAIAMMIGVWIGYVLNGILSSNTKQDETQKRFDERA